MNRSLMLLLFVAFISCSDSGPNGPDIEIEYHGFSWAQIALQDTIVFDITATSTGEIYAFTGLEVYYSNSDTELDFTEIVSLRNRRGFHADPETGWLVSVQDSSVQYASSPENAFSEFVFDSTTISSSILNQQFLYITSSSGDIFTFNIGTQAVDTLYSSTQNEDLRLISLIGDQLYLKQGFEIVRLNTVTRDFSSSGLPTTNINGIISAGENEVLMAATVNQKILKSEDGGENWTGIGPAEIAANSVTDLFTTEDGFLYSSFLGSGVFLSNDLGTNWISQTNTDLDWNTYSVEYVPGIGLIAGTATGIYLQIQE